jgi:ribose transport system permease protein
VALLIANTSAVHGFWESAAIAATLANAAPLMLAGVACTPAMLLGGIDISVGPLMGFVDVAFIVWLEPAGLSSAWLAVPLILLMGAALGLLNGFLVGYVRVPAIVVTLGTYLFLVGLSVTVMPTPEGSMPSWLTRFAGQFGPVPGALILILVPLLAWWAFSRSRLYTEMLAVGDSEKAAFTAGIPAWPCRRWWARVTPASVLPTR